MNKSVLVFTAAMLIVTLSGNTQPPYPETDVAPGTVTVHAPATKQPVPVPAITPLAEYKAPPAPAPVSAPVRSAATASGTNEAMQFIFLHESTNRLAVVNSIGACGLGQALPCSKLANACPNWQTDAACQISFFTDYANARYGGWENAKAFWLSHSWW